VEEEPDAVGKAHLAQEQRHRNEMVVVDPDRVVRLQQRREPPGEGLVHAQISGGVFPREAGEIEPVVAHGPEAAVGEPEIVFVEVLLRQIGHRVADAAELMDVQRARLPFLRDVA
jgi:hypothetical protein